LKIEIIEEKKYWWLCFQKKKIYTFFPILNFFFLKKMV